MNTTISEKDQKKLFKALNRMQTVQSDQKKKSFEKLFKKFSQIPTLEEALNSLTVAELKEIKRVWDVNVASTAKKGELVKEIGLVIKENIISGIGFFDTDRVKELYSLVDVEVSEKLFSGMNSVIYFRKLGLIFPAIIDGKKILVCPTEIKEQLDGLKEDKEFKALISKNDDILEVTRGYLHVYGTFTIAKCMELIKSSTGHDVEYDWFIQLILQRYSFRGEEYTICGDSISHIDVFDHMDIAEKNSKLEYDYKEFPVETIKNFGRFKYGEDSESRKNMKELLLNAYKMEMDDAEEIVAACEYAIKNDKELQFIMDYLGHNLVINDVDIYSKILKLLVQLKDDTVHWAMKGHTPNGLKKNKSTNVKAKVGRNDSCPCGSGKKFKKCCGKN